MRVQTKILVTYPVSLADRPDVSAAATAEGIDPQQALRLVLSVPAPEWTGMRETIMTRGRLTVRDWKRVHPNLMARTDAEVRILMRVLAAETGAAVVEEDALPGDVLPLEPVEDV